jgi:transcriptional regulator of arginine metabolism
VTQATVSRDIRELGLFRAASPDGSRYAVRAGLGARAANVLRDFVLSVEAVEFIAVLHTPPGTANLVAVALDEAGWPEVAGTVAGDDTVMVVLRAKDQVATFEARISGGGDE